MTPAAQQDLREFIFSKTDDPAIRARTNMIAEWALEAAPEVRAKERLEVQLEEARVLLRRVLAVRRFALSGVDQARIDACTDLDTLQRWHDQAILAANVGEALR